RGCARVTPPFKAIDTPPGEILAVRAIRGHVAYAGGAGSVECRTPLKPSNAGFVAGDRQGSERTAQPVESTLLSLSSTDDRMSGLRLRLLEHARLEPMSLQELVELRPIALRELRGLRDVAPGDLQQPNEIVALECLACFLEGHERRGVFLERRLNQRGRDDLRGREGDGLLEQVQQLADVAGPGRRHQPRHRIR